MSMRSLFKYSTNKVFNKKTLILLSSNPFSSGHVHFSTLAPDFFGGQYESIREAALKKYGLSHLLKLTWPKSVDSSAKVDYMKKNPDTISQMYGESDLSQLPIFQGGFINFGYLPNSFLNKGKVTTEERIVCSKEMYRVIANLGNILSEYSLLEVGCGLGYGSSLVSQEYKPKLVIGMDISPEQIAIAQKYQVSGI